MKTDDRFSRRNLILGFRLGLLVATGLSIWVCIQRLVRGTGPFDQLGITWQGAVLTYYLAFAAGGLVVGALLHLRSLKAGSIILGVLLVFPTYLAVLLQLRSPVDPVAPALIQAGLLSIMVGGLVGLWSWREDRDANASSRQHGSSSGGT